MAATASLSDGLDRSGFIARFGDVYQHNPWVAAAAFDSGATCGTVEGLATAMRAVVGAAPEAAQLTLIGAQPGDAAALMAQAPWTPAEAEALHRLLGVYRARFGFPFVIAAQGLAPAAILEQCAQRMGNGRASEMRAALDELHQIARQRLMALAADARSG